LKIELKKANEIEFSHRISLAEKELKEERIEMARLRSLENVRLKKFKEKKKMLKE